MSEPRLHHVDLTEAEIGVLTSLVDEQLGAARMLVELSNKLKAAAGVRPAA